MLHLVMSAPARLHLGLIGMNGEIGRIGGGVGLLLTCPHTLIEVKKADGIHVECRDEPEMVERITKAITAVKEHY